MKRAIHGRGAAVALAAALAAADAGAGESVTYSAGGTEFEGYHVPAEGEARGLVLIVHDWDGLGDYERRRADMLAEMGYDAFALDLFGRGVRPETTEARRAETGRLYADRPEMRARLLAGLGAARERSDAGAAVVIGYCFGGAAALELARSGAADDIAGYASFHGGLSTPEGQSWSGDVPPILILHGGADSSVTMADVATVAEELEAAGADYEIQVYSGAPHAFTVFGSDRYRERADERSWEAFAGFLADRL